MLYKTPPQAGEGERGDGDSMNVSFTSLGALASASKRAKEKEAANADLVEEEEDDAFTTPWRANARYTDDAYEYDRYYSINDEPTAMITPVLLLAAAR